MRARRFARVPTARLIAPSSARWRSLRVAAPVAVIVILAVLFFTTTVSGAFAWQSIAYWTRGTFGFSQKAQPNAELASLHDALTEHGITDPLAPAWLPDGYTLSNLTVNDLPGLLVFIAFFQNGDNNLTVQITSSPGDTSSSNYEKDDAPVTTYVRNGITHYFMTNDSRVKVVWTYENYECFISGDITENEARKMIDSIYDS